MVYSSRKSAIQRAREYLAVRPVFFDTETTGLGPDAEIIEVSVIDHDGIELFDSLVRPNGRIPLDAMQIHGISNEMVKDMPIWPDIWPALRTVLNGRYIGIYNAEFDLRMIRQTHQVYNLAWDLTTGKIFDIMKLYADYTGSQRWVSLEKAGRQCGIPLPNAHRARADTLLLRALLQHIASRLT
jgi:DNA polymerase-3 subunit epsilon